MRLTTAITRHAREMFQVKTTRSRARVHGFVGRRLRYVYRVGLEYQSRQGVLLREKSKHISGLVNSRVFQSGQLSNRLHDGTTLTSPITFTAAPAVRAVLRSRQ